MTMIFGVQPYRWEVTHICYVYKLIVQLEGEERDVPARTNPTHQRDLNSICYISN